MLEFTALRKTFAQKQRLKGSKDDIFPLLCPTREYDWIDGWRCDLLFSESGFAEPHCVFKTTDSTTRLEEIWVVSRYDPPERIEFVKFAAGLYVMKYEIALEQNEPGIVEATWTFHVTGLSNKGNGLIEKRTQEQVTEMVLALEAKLNHYLATGECLRS